MIKFLLSLGSFVSLWSPSVLACQPPPPNYFEFGSLRAIVESSEVIKKMGMKRVTGIRVVPGTGASSYVVEAGNCKLEVTVEARQENPRLPCGGPFTFTAKPAEEVVCQ